MAEFQYKAFISYSHRDEAWATWLHKALESYRLPRKLVGTKGRYGTIPAKLFPVFRDRDELSSASDLSERVQAALRDSASLVVICSPAAAASRWVNEEIRSFRALGRGDRIHCIVVDGDPQADRLEDSAFPPALLESEVGEAVEPLAADARKWADGKSLALLKLVSGMLGVRLDALRQREQQRKRRRRLLLLAGTGLTLALAIVAVVSSLSERQRAKELALQREQAERFASFVVGMNDELTSELSTETLALFAGQLYGHLESIDRAFLTPETRKQVAIVLRTLGQVSQDKNRPNEAMDAFVRSRHALAELAASHPENSDFLFELAQAEYYIGNLAHEQGQSELAHVSMQLYQEAARALVERDPANPAWVLELASSYTNLAVVGLRDVERRTEVTSNLRRGIELADEAIALSHVDEAFRDEYASILSWAGDLQLTTCDLDGALETHRKSLQLATSVARERPSDNDLRRRHAFALLVLANVERMVGRLDDSSENVRRARDMLEMQSEQDPGNIKARRDALRADSHLAELLGEMESPETLIGDLLRLEAEYRNLSGLNDASGPTAREFNQFLVMAAGVAMRADRPDLAEEWLRESLAGLAPLLEASPDRIASRRQLHRVHYLWWELMGSGLPGRFAGLEERYPLDDTSGSCEQQDILSRTAIIKGNIERAREHASYLAEQGYRDPAYLRFCRRHQLCEG